MTFQSIIKSTSIFLLKLTSFIPALFVMYCIYSFSAQEGTTSSQLSSGVSQKIVVTVDKIFDFNLTSAQISKGSDKIEHYIRKTAHFTEYFILAVTVSIPLYVFGIRGIWLVLTSMLLCTGFACLDEYHQLFVNGRSGSPKDVLIDSVGSFTGIICTRIAGYIARKTIFEPLFQKK